MNLTLTERDKKLLGLTACLAILAIFGVHLIRPALAEQEALGGEYEAALRNLQNNAAGAMPGNPYGAQGPYGTQAVGCSCCDMCMAMACMDMCCSCGRGGC